MKTIESIDAEIARLQAEREALIASTPVAHSIEEIRAALDRIHRRACGESVSYMSIPPNPWRDADLILSAAIDELERLRTSHTDGLGSTREGEQPAQADRETSPSASPVGAEWTGEQYRNAQRIVEVARGFRQGYLLDPVCEMASSTAPSFVKPIKLPTFNADPEVLRVSSFWRTKDAVFRDAVGHCAAAIRAAGLRVEGDAARTQEEA